MQERKLADLIRRIRPALGAIVLGVIAVGVLIAGDIEHLRGFIEGILAGNPMPVLAVGTATIASTLGGLFLLHHKHDERMGAELTTLKSEMRTRNNDSERISSLEGELAYLRNNVFAGGYPVSNTHELYRAAEGTVLSQFQTRYIDEVNEWFDAAGDVHFEATEWAGINILPRLVKNTAPSRWIICLPRHDNVNPAFGRHLAFLVPRKIVFLVDWALEEARKKGLDATADHIRIALIDDGMIDECDRYQSITHLTRVASGDQLETVAISYFRGASAHQPELMPGKVFFHPAPADAARHLEVINRYYHHRSSVQLTYAEFKAAVNARKFPSRELMAAPGFPFDETLYA